MHTVIIMGAGASVEAGAPLMADFLDRAEDYLHDPNSGIRSRDSFRLAIDALRGLRSIHATSYIDLNNLEAFLGVVEMQQLLDEQKSMLGHLSTVIVETLEEAITFRRDVQNFNERRVLDRVLADPANLELASILADLQRAGTMHTAGVITFNYDTVLEVALADNGCSIDYGFDPALARGSTPFLKLHGSIGWGWCDTCKRIERTDVAKLIGLSTTTDMSKILTPVRIRPFEDIQRHPCRNCRSAFRPTIVPPSWNKSEYRESLVQVWRHAAAQLGKADRIVVIGYSLPESDAFFRYLFALGTNSSTNRLRLVWVVNKDDDGSAEARMRQFIGRGIIDRVVFHRGEEGTFSYCVKRLRELLVHSNQVGLRSSKGSR